MLDERVSATKPREVKPSEEVLGAADRLISRLAGFRDNLNELRERVSGATPPDAGKGEAATAFTVGGFVGNAGTALERAHAIVGDIEETLGRIATVI